MLGKPLHTLGFPNSDCVSPGHSLHKQREDSKSIPLGKPRLPTLLSASALSNLLPYCIFFLPCSEVLRLWFLPPSPNPPAWVPVRRQYRHWCSGWGPWRCPSLLSSLSCLPLESSLQSREPWKPPQSLSSKSPELSPLIPSLCKMKPATGLQVDSKDPTPSFLMNEHIY